MRPGHRTSAFPRIVKVVFTAAALAGGVWISQILPLAPWSPAEAAKPPEASDPCKKYPDICNDFATSLHNTRLGKPRHYNAEHGGFEQLTGVPYDTLPCKDCHDPANLNTSDPYQPGCFDCHADTTTDKDTNPFNDKVADSTCLGCHSRQKAEHGMYTDVHRSIGMTCMDCHAREEMHGDGVQYSSMQEPGAMKTSCTQAGCHRPSDLVLPNAQGARKGKGSVTPRAVEFHSQHLDSTDCSACHVQSVVACDSCHFESELAHNKRFYRQIPQKGFKLLLNNDGKVHTGSFQSLTWGSTENPSSAVSFYVIGPYVAHTISKGENVACDDCHLRVDSNDQILGGNAALAQYFTQRTMTMSRWVHESVDDGNPATYGVLEAPNGVIPIPEDFGQALQWDFVYWTLDPSAPVVKDSSGANWNYLKSGPNMVHMPFGTPLTNSQMQKLILRSPGN